VSLGHGKKLVESVQPGEIIAFPPVEESSLPDVNVEEAKKWTERKSLCQSL
jgi:hypothetical protein